MAIKGTSGNDLLDGSKANDRIYGLGGDDTINGAGGSDILLGGQGDDVLDGGAGRDRLIGGNGNDHLFDIDAGNGSLNGNSGNDLFTLFRSDPSGKDTIVARGGDGLDEIDFSATTASQATVIAKSGGDTDMVDIQFARHAVVHGGGGDDQLHLSDVEDASILGNAGADNITCSVTLRVEINAGGGDDIVTCVGDGGGSFDVILNKGLDQVAPILVDHHHEVFDIEIVDFATGAGGDRLNLQLFASSEFVDWDGGDPFAEGYLSLVDVRGFAMLRVDFDGAGVAYGMADWISLDNTKAADFTADNFDGFVPG